MQLVDLFELPFQTQQIVWQRPYRQYLIPHLNVRRRQLFPSVRPRLYERKPVVKEYQKLIVDSQHLAVFATYTFCSVKQASPVNHPFFVS